MSPSLAHVQGRTSARPWTWLAVLLAVGAVTCLIVALQAASPGVPRGVVVEPDPVAPSSTDPEPSPAAPAGAPPVGLRIPAIEVDATVTRLGLQQNRTVEVPSNPANTGWYRLGPPPGQPGSAVILGHVDSVQGPAVFYRLRYLKPGDRVIVDAADGSTSTFEVLRLATYPNEDFPADKVYVSSGAGRLLNLITCGGDYDPESGYQANVVVYTRMVN